MIFCSLFYIVIHLIIILNLFMLHFCLECFCNDIERSLHPKICVMFLLWITFETDFDVYESCQSFSVNCFSWRAIYFFFNKHEDDWFNFWGLPHPLQEAFWTIWRRSWVKIGTWVLRLVAAWKWSLTCSPTLYFRDTDGEFRWVSINSWIVLFA